MVPAPACRQVAYRKTISVNDPLRYNGVTMYQTDWGLSGMQVQLRGPSGLPALAQGQVVQLPMASLEGKGGIGGRIWAAFVPTTDDPDSRQGLSLLARDPRQVVVYNSKGEFAGVRRPGSGTAIEVEGVTITVEDVIGSTGLELKLDPGIPWVYAGFAGMMVTVSVSYFSHSQVWAFEEDEEGGVLLVGGKANRAKLAFSEEMGEILDQVPEVQPAAVGR